MPKQQWQPVEKYSQQEIIRHQVIETTIEGRMITMQDSMGYELSMLLRPDYAVCKLVDVDTPPPMPDEVRETIRRELQSQKEYIILTWPHPLPPHIQKRIAKIDAALPWLDGLAKE